MNKSDFFYDLPPELIAQTAAEPRDSSRLLVYHRSSGLIEHRIFSDVTDYLKKGDVLVINNTRVIKARLLGHIQDKETRVEVLLLNRLNLTDWEAITRPARRLRLGTKLYFTDELSAEITGIGEMGVRTVRFVYSGVFEEILELAGKVPLPPYITTELKDEERYQTVYSKVEGSSAAPTAGLHFTVELLEKIRGMGVEIAEILLHVGLSTFRPVKAEQIEDHKMHNEHYEISEAAANIINSAKIEGRRVIAVGTTSVRTLESAADVNGIVKAMKGDTEIFIYPGYKFKAVNALITNFHLPESTLIMLVSALMGLPETMRMYNTAVKERYRFFSFGDATMII